jgi:hypothetical protein
MYRVCFFSNGNTAVFNGEEQVPLLQQSWLLMFVAFLKSKNIDPLKTEFNLPNGRKAALFETECGYNWEISA